MAELRIQGAEPPSDAAVALGQAVAATLAHLGRVLDREDRLEAGTGVWRAGFAADGGAVHSAVRQSVLRTLDMASDPTNFAILELVVGDAGASPADLAARLGLDRLSVAERVSDLVAGGLVAKLPEADRIVPTPAAAELVRLVASSAAVGAAELGRELT